jgi:RHS repeat-associated protein
LKHCRRLEIPYPKLVKSRSQQLYADVLYRYEERGLPVSESREILSNAYSLAYGYDANGNRNWVTYPDATVATYTYDFADRPYSVKVGSTSVVTSAAYEPFGPVTSVVYGNGATRTASYDLRYRPQENTLVAGSTKLADYTYGEDALGNITQINDTLTTGYSRTFTYDDLDRLLTADVSSLWGNWTYSYDSMGNLTELKQGSSALRSFSYSGTTPKLTQVVEGGVTRPVSYDSAGNETSVGSPVAGPTPYAFAYSPRNLLASAGDTGGTPLTYLYDGFERRAVTQGISGSKTRYSFYDPMDTLLSESALTSSGKPSIAFDYIWFGELPIAQDSSGTLSYTFDDHLGTPILQTNSSAAITWRGEYEPYGSIYALRGTNLHQPLRLPGQVAEQFDTGANGATERSYNVYRWYRPGWARFTQADPIGLRAGLNIFGFADGNPVRLGDPLGLEVWLVWRKAWPWYPKLGFTFYHTYLLIIPSPGDNICDLSRRHFTKSRGATTVSGDVVAPDFLNSVPDYDFYQGGAGELLLRPPGGMSESQFINLILNADNSYPNYYVPYSPLPGLPQDSLFYFNSNSFISGLLRSIGVTNIQLPSYLNDSNLPLWNSPVWPDLFTGGSTTCNCGT